MKRMRRAALVLLTSLLAGGAATHAAPLVNTFERPEADKPYALAEWAADGWNAPWELGMDARTLIDTRYANSGDQSLRVFYPQGKFDPQDSGVLAPFALEPGQEYYLSYWVRFDENFSWGTTSYAGKLGLGLSGGGACSDGETCTGYNGFNSRISWRSGGQAAVYYYDMGNHSNYGQYVALQLEGEDIYYPKDEWINIVQRLKVNTVKGGHAYPDGEIQVWYNGESAAHITDLRFVRNRDKVDTAYFSTFFGGATAAFAPAGDSYAWYDDITVSADPADICELRSEGCPADPDQVRSDQALPEQVLPEPFFSDHASARAVFSAFLHKILK
ncbi:hypothetical protein IDH44_18075 [Paenibacillus sp. IB182496]|uniref:Polysaccharide lyase 14 domain-containing protein n=1 Tax=Paenibacillus sabuli TaxID=2772509 RepID=A0A927GTH7_9BACL|nr:hypothetical protein [Paenibacillus sabuli]MBD2847110.1 hypothetical protein [Paenibacillus sabuli]